MSKRGRKPKFLDHNGLKYTLVVDWKRGKVIETKGSLGFRVVTPDFKHIAFSFDKDHAIEILRAQRYVA